MFVFSIAAAEKVIDLARCVDRALAECEMTRKEMALILYGSPDLARLSKALSGDQPLDDWRLVKMPWMFQVRYEAERFRALRVALLDDVRPLPVKAALPVAERKVG